METITPPTKGPPTLLLVHGWGFGPGFWRPLQRVLPSWPHHTLNLGFSGKPNLDLPAQGPFVAVGHSTGVLWILRQWRTTSLAERCVGLISINGFPCFARRSGFPQGVHPRLLQQMSQDLEGDLEGVMERFMVLGGVRPGLAVSRGAMDIQTLKCGLEWLLQWDERHTLHRWNLPWLALAHRDDMVVTEAMTLESFVAGRPLGEGQLHWFERGGHFLPLIVDPSPYAQVMRDFLQRYVS